MRSYLLTRDWVKYGWHSSAGLLDPLSLTIILRLVVLRESNTSPVLFPFVLLKQHSLLGVFVSFGPLLVSFLVHSSHDTSRVTHVTGSQSSFRDYQCAGSGSRQPRIEHLVSQIEVCRSECLFDHFILDFVLDSVEDVLITIRDSFFFKG